MDESVDGLAVPVRVRPGSSHPGVGGRYGDGQLVVAVAARPVDGAANDAVVAAVAAAFGVRRREVRLLSGATNRSKLLHVAGDPQALSARLVLLLGN